LVAREASGVDDVARCLLFVPRMMHANEERPGRAHPGRLLLVCGDRLAARRLAAWLEQGTLLNVTVAHDGRTGWVLSQAGRWAALVADADLPDFPGLELLCQSKTLAPDVPTILLTEHDPAALALDELTFAVDAVLGRPCSREELLETLARHVGPGAVQETPSLERVPVPAPKMPPAAFPASRATLPGRAAGEATRWGAALTA
jgi:CheY-like chemotaxis protein